MSDRTGWFADVSSDDDPGPAGMWQPCLETGKGHIPCLDIWFDTQEECEAYIKEDLIPIAGRMLPDFGGAA